MRRGEGVWLVDVMKRDYGQHFTFKLTFYEDLHQTEMSILSIFTPDCTKISEHNPRGTIQKINVIR